MAGDADPKVVVVKVTAAVAAGPQEVGDEAKQLLTYQRWSGMQ
jgi:hypothetical protein